MDKIKSSVYSNPDISTNSTHKDLQPSVVTRPSSMPQYDIKHGGVFRYFGIFALVAFFLFLVYFLLTGPFAQMTKATVALTPSKTESMLFAHPLTIKADGADKSKIDIFIASEDGKPLANKNISVSTTIGELVPTAGTTDSSGHAVFELTATTPGIATLSYSVDGESFGQAISVKAE